MKSDKELKKNFKTYLDKNNVIFHVLNKMELDRDDSVCMSELEYEGVKKILDKNNHKEFSLFVNLLKLAKNVSYMSSGARQNYKKMIMEKQLKKIAIVGNNIFLKVLAGFLSRAAGVSNKVKWFTREDKAFDWFKESK